MAAVVVAMVLLVVLLSTGRVMSAQGSDKPVPPEGTSGEPSPYVDIAPTDEELLNAPPSIERYVSAHSLPAGTLLPADLTQSTALASSDSVPSGGVFQFSVNVANSGQFDIPATLVAGRPGQIDFIDIACAASGTASCSVEDGAIEWQGIVPGGESVAVLISARVSSGAAPGTTLSVPFRIVSAEQTLERSAGVVVGVAVQSLEQFLPFTMYGLQPNPGPVTLTAGSPNSSNTWLLSWTESPNASGYELQESHDPAFGIATTYLIGPDDSYSVTQEPSPFNVFYYRVRSRVGLKEGPWSNVESVVGGYHDDFENPNTGWAMRRSTYREEVHGFYEEGKYVMQVLDRWDWGLSSPLMPAPRVPYELDFEAKIVAPANLLSFGVVFGGDWNGQNCPPGISFDEWYLHKNCFNHFYNTNSIFYGPIKLLFERVDQLVWCLDCGGSPMKRLGDINFDGAEDYNNIDPEGWNHYRIEVREGSIKVYAAKRGAPLEFQYEYNDTRWIGEPYFGVFASTDEYNNSTWRFEYMKVLPLD